MSPFVLLFCFIFFFRRIYFISVMGHASYSRVWPLNKQTLLCLDWSFNVSQLSVSSAFTIQVSAQRLGSSLGFLQSFLADVSYRCWPGTTHGQGLKPLLIYGMILCASLIQLLGNSLPCKFLLPQHSRTLFCSFHFIETALSLDLTSWPLKKYAPRQKTGVIVGLNFVSFLFSGIIVLC